MLILSSSLATADIDDGLCMVSLDNEIRERNAEGKVVRVIEDLDGIKMAKPDIPEIKMGFMTGLNRLPNGNTVVCFYQRSHQLIEVTPEKELIWKWRVSTQRTVVSVQVLDQPGDVLKGEF